MSYAENVLRKLNKKLGNVRKAVNSMKNWKQNEVTKKLCKELQEALNSISEENIKNLVHEIEEKQSELKRSEEKYTNLNEYKYLILEEMNFLKTSIVELKGVVQKNKEEKAYLMKYLRMNQLLVQEYQMRQEGNLGITNSQSPGGIRFNTNLIQEVESLQTILQLKNEEIKKLRLALTEAEELETQLELAKKKEDRIAGKYEELQEQLRTKLSFEQQLVDENSQLRKNLIEGSLERKKLFQQNEELQWKLNEKTTSAANDSPCHSGENPSPHPRILSLVNKSNSVSYLLDFDVDENE